MTRARVAPADLPAVSSGRCPGSAARAPRPLPWPEPPAREVWGRDPDAGPRPRAPV